MVCSPILGEGPGAGVTWAHEEKAAACHTSGKPHASVRWRGAGGGMFPKGPPISGVPVPVPIRVEAQRIFGARTTQLSCPSSTAWSLCDTGPITDVPVHASEAQERTEDKGSSDTRHWRSLDRGTVRPGWGDQSQPFLGTEFPFGGIKSPKRAGGHAQVTQ